MTFKGVAANLPEEARAAGLIVALSTPLGCAEYIECRCDYDNEGDQQVCETTCLDIVGGFVRVDGTGDGRGEVQDCACVPVVGGWRRSLGLGKKAYRVISGWDRRKMAIEASLPHADGDLVCPCCAKDTPW